ncbi:MAG: hypothetical protein J7647_24780 [Cyanobacteria bacterium SBLK]|nr:hypothetical protein [Cyanobacteria bacterium SBLK]
MPNSGYGNIASLLHSTIDRARPRAIDNSQTADRIAQISHQLDRNELQQKLAQLDLSAIKTALMSSHQGGEWTTEQIDLAIARYLYFLFLTYLHPDRILIPSREVDLVWHEHILHDTRNYTRDCQMLFSDTVHHARQSQLWDNAIQENARIATRQTRSLFDFYAQGISPDDLLSRKICQPARKIGNCGACGHPN